VLIVGGIGPGWRASRRASRRGAPPRSSRHRTRLRGDLRLRKFGADVGAAIDFPAGVACAAMVITGGRRRWIVLVVLIPLIVLALLALADLVTGANSHFTRSVLDAGGLHSLGDVAPAPARALRHSFGRPVLLIGLPVIAVLAVVAWRRRERSRRLGRRRAGDAGRPGRGRGGHRRRHPGQRFGRSAARDRRRISAGFYSAGPGLEGGGKARTA